MSKISSQAKPFMSVVIPCYNEELYIEEALRSVSLQDYNGKYEVIVVDNNCEDTTVSIAKKYGATVVKEPNPGVCQARQAGTAAAKGDIIISTDADTVFDESWLSNIYKSFKDNPECVAVTGPCRYIDGPWWGRTYPQLLFGVVSGYSRLFKAPFYVTATNIAFKKTAFTEYNTTLTQGGDELELLHDLKKQGGVHFDNTNPVYTSGRRLYRGLFYNIFVTFLTYYMLGYYLNRLFNRTFIGTAPAYRFEKSQTQNITTGLIKYGATLSLIAFVHLPSQDSIIEQAGELLSKMAHIISLLV
jgi:glycosyltransferase involved in cell wall biosynthesis